MSGPWLDSMVKQSGVVSHKVDFNTMLDHPVEEAEKLCEFCGVPRLPDDVVLSWVHPEYSRSRT
jgi:hypothetical protein